MLIYYNYLALTYYNTLKHTFVVKRENTLYFQYNFYTNLCFIRSIATWCSL